jgi:hypothetical protein
MAINQRLHGKNGQIKIDTAGGVALVTLADASKWSLDMTTDRVIVTAFSDTNQRRASGLPDFSGSLEGRWNAATSPTYFAAVLAGNPVTLRLIENSLDAGVYHQGLANIDGNITVDFNGAINWTGKWDAAGNWAMNVA